VYNFAVSENRKKASRNQSPPANTETREDAVEIDPGYASLGTDQSSGTTAYETLASTGTESDHPRRSDAVYEDIDVNDNYLELVDYLEPRWPIITVINAGVTGYDTVPDSSL